MITFKEFLFINELSYENNVGIMELVKFYSTAKPEHVIAMKKLIAAKKHKEAWDMIQQHTGVKLHTSAFGKNV